MELGAPRDKLVLGMPLYGRCWKLDDVQNDSGYFASGRKPTKGGPYTNEPGLMGYNEVSTINSKWFEIVKKTNSLISTGAINSAQMRNWGNSGGWHESKKP